MIKRVAFTLTELMVSVVVISVFIVVAVESFKYIQRGIQFSKDRTIAINLAQEKMQIVKQKLYYKVVSSTYTDYLDDFNPSIPYDTYYFPPENILEAGVQYTRYTYIIPVVESGGQIVELPPQTPDTGMKKITVTVVWKNNNEKKKVQISNIYTNRDTAMSNSAITGSIKDSYSFVPIPGAMINIAEYMGVRGVSDSNGNYLIDMTPGNYTLYIEARGYFPYLGMFSVGPNQTLTQNVLLTKMASGEIRGYPWIRDHLVISQVVGSTVNPSGFDQEYIEIFNPTTYTWLVNGNVGLKFQRIYDNEKKIIQIDYINNSISSGGFYLFANTSPVIINQIPVYADAVWSDSNSSSDFPYFNPGYNIIPVFGDGPDEGGGAVELYDILSSKTIDSVGWNRNNGASGKKQAPFYEGSAISQDIGLQIAEQYVRYSSTNGPSIAYGPSYDSNNNSVDFYDYTSGISVSPNNSSSPSKTVVSATPAYGAIVGCNDGFSISTNAYTVGNPPYSYFDLTQIATGTWSCSISSNTYGVVMDTITISSGSITSLNSVFLDTQITWGYVSGMVTDVFGANITPAIKVISDSGSSAYVASNKRYMLNVSTGMVNVTVNPNNLDTRYVSISSSGINVLPGEINSSVDFVLFQGGRISGYVTIAGSTVPLGGVAVAIYDSYDTLRDEQITANNGRFITNVLSTGTYVVEPMVDSKENVNPSTATVTIATAGSTVFSTTFTVSSSLGYVKGSVKFHGNIVKSGALILVTTVTLTGTPPAPPILSSQTITGAPYYMASSYEDGSYSVEVRQSTNPKYNVYSYYPDLNGSTFTIYWSSKNNISVLGGQSVGGIDFSW
ncbi:MAG: carboxypeptidase regulatory-like domain-containing protein [Elusimicrobia bacterium]|jgi:type II secretory pathway pseudopilin PulG|nr:carboxypeptidase regulatory-like domain-containing protein [Elusimicrobiota bacterium]